MHRDGTDSDQIKILCTRTISTNKSLRPALRKSQTIPYLVEFIYYYNTSGLAYCMAQTKQKDCDSVVCGATIITWRTLHYIAATGADSIFEFPQKGRREQAGNCSYYICAAESRLIVD